ncbi:MAG: trans-sulfuration enzyme family protein [Bacteroidota bacterium]
MNLSTRLIHDNNIENKEQAVVPPLFLSTTFERGASGADFPGGYIYGRYDNPNRHILEEKLADMEKGANCVSFSSGMAAATAVFQSLQSGDHILLPDDTYFVVRQVLDVLFSRFGITYTLVDMTRPDSLPSAIRPSTKLIWIETPSNPLLKVTDIEAIVKFAKQHNYTTVVDNTWPTPYFTQPIALGADIVLHSTTKYLGGHCDLIGGALVFKKKDAQYELIRNIQKLGGAIPSPYDCWMLCRSLSTFPARMHIHSNNAMQLAQYLEQHPMIEKVFYPGLPSHPQHTIAQKQMKGGYGGMISILIKGNQQKALNIAGKLKFFKHATSLGGVESLVEHRKSIEGVNSKTPDNLLRISVGIEHIDDLIKDWEQALG